MLFYENEYYQVHILQEESDERALYYVVNKLTSIMEGKHEVLPNALSLADAYSGALESFLKDAKGRFNPSIQEQPAMVEDVITEGEQINVEDTIEPESAE